MKLDQLVTFSTVVRAGSISKAAEALHLTQPAVSQQIRSLESEFGLRLLERSNEGVRPTEAGDILMHYARRMLVLYKGLSEEIENLKENCENLLLVGAGTAIGGYALPCSIYLFREKYPRVSIKLKVSNTQEVLSLLLDRRIQVGLVEGPVPDTPELASAVLAQDELVLIAPPRVPWLQGESVTLDELRQLPLILRESGSGTRKAVTDALGSKGLDLQNLNVIMELNSLDAIKASVEAGRGVSLMSRWAIRKELRTGALRAVRVEGLSFPCCYIALWRPDRNKTPLEKRFLRFLRSPKERGFC
jgi:DNA-binding transcriptional LysR family regulator